MSSTNRGGDRHASDYYVTPQYEIEKFLEKFVENNEVNVRWTVLDPSAGGDSKHDMSYPSALSKLFGNIVTMDIREDSLAEHKCVNYLTSNIVDYCEKPNIIITNPPFSDAIEFVKKGLDDVAKNGYVIMLLRLNFLGSSKRNEWLRNNMPYEIYVHGKRMSFTEDGKTDSIEYAHFVWKKGHKGISKLYLLEFD